MITPPANARSGEYGFGRDYTTISNDCFMSISDLDYTRTLDIGCGGGRLANGFLINNANLEYYVGIDVRPECIEWCNRTFTTVDPIYTFYHIEMNNMRYHNKHYKPNLFDNFIPFNKQYTLIHVYSVFSHLCPNDTQFYFKKIRECLQSKGIVYLTAFVESDFYKNYEENPPHKKLTAGRLHCCLYNKKYFESLINQTGLKIIECSCRNQQWNDGQLLYVLTVD
tara:strand:- start:122 stop:793 length:672 start_codon:yes stop_codon:yes gene_type:complete